MCGIAGIVKFPGAADWGERGRRALEAMSEKIARRGPDGAGIFVDARPGVLAALVHRRLAIVDLPGGAQPMGNEDGAVRVVFNGEIYNHAELRRELIAAGHRFGSDHSDTEVLVHGWEEWGTDLPGRLLGMFAFAIWDFRAAAGAGTLFFARDRMGQKPLFYAALEDGIVFGSTIPSVLAWPEVPRRVPREQVGLYLQMGFIPPPQTIWRDVQQVSPGHWVRLRGDVLDGGAYWHGTDAATRRQGDTARGDASARGLRELLGEAVGSQLMADVPVACFLSGGVDSSIVAMLMQLAALARGGAAIQTVSVGFKESGFDETAYAAAVAKKIGSRHTRLEVNASQDVMGVLSGLMRGSLGQPFADSSILPTYHLSEAVRGIAPVALSGDGADELFGGYDRYRAAALLSRWRGVAKFLPKAAPVGTLAKRERYRRLAAAARETEAAERYTRLLEIFPPELTGELLGEPAQDFACQELPTGDGVTAVRQAMLRDQAEYLPGDVLWKVDTASMAFALEVRSPFLDHRVVEFANGLPDAAIFGGGRGKQILREAFGADLPAEVFSRRKMGFGVPVGAWFRGPLEGAVRELLLAESSRTGALLQGRVIQHVISEHASMLRDHTHRIFSLLMLELFLREYTPSIED